MSKSNLFKQKAMTIGSALLFTINILFSNTPNNAEMIRRIESLTTVIDIRVNDEVMDQVTKLVEHRKRDAATILGRSSMLFPSIERVLAENGVPTELKYIAVIESSLIPFVKSRQGATGMWQFMQGTASMYGIFMDKHIDDRMDIETSTRTATRYLKALYEIYHDWNLVLAAYNCGDGTVSRAMQKSGLTNYWDLAKHLPTETKKYIPRFIAAMYLDKYYDDHDIEPNLPSEFLTKTATVKVFDKVDFKHLSKELGIDIDYIKFLNPRWRKELIPHKKGESYTLTLPQEIMYTYIERYNSLDNLVLPSENAFATADQQQAAQELLAEMRQQVSIRQLRKSRSASHTLRDSFKDELLISDIRNVMAMSEQKDYKLYQLKRKESLSDVARKNNITLEDLMDMNDFTSENDINPGSIIKLSK